MKRYLAHTLFVFLGIFAIFLCLEITLRLTGLYYRKSAPLPAPGNTQQFVILCIGDSFVQGMGAPPEKSYPRQLEEMLNQERLPKQVKVINTGMVGKNIEQIYERFHNDIETIRPDLVVFLGGAISGINLYGYHAFVESRTRMARLMNYVYSIRTFKLLQYLIWNVNERRKLQGWQERKTGAVQDMTQEKPVVLPSEAQTAFEKGKAYNDKGDYPRAAEAFKRSVALCPQKNPSYKELALICELYGKYAEALACFEQGQQAQMQFDHYSYCNFGQLYRYQCNNIDKAYEMFRRGFEANPLEISSFNFKLLVELYYDHNPKAQNLHGQIRQYLDSMKNKTTRDNRMIIESLDNKVDVKRSIEQWKVQGINKIIDLCQEKRIPIILQDYPENYCYEDIAQRRSVPFVCQSRVFAELLRHAPREKYISNDAYHCNASGYRVMAQNIFNTIMRMGIIESRGMRPDSKF